MESTIRNAGRTDVRASDLDDTRRPSWWKDEHNSAWERVKAAFRRDWEQTKHDFGADTAPELNQDVGDTVKQAVGKQNIPPRNVPNPPDADERPSDDFDYAEPALRYGYGASSQYASRPWDDSLESDLRRDWDDMKTGRGWDEVRSHVRRGYSVGGKY